MVGRAGDVSRDPSASIDVRVDDLLARMTLEEKVAQLAAKFPSHFVTGDAVDRDALERLVPHGIGQLSMVTMLARDDPRPMVEALNAIQRYLVEETRLGIPAICHAEAVSGLMQTRASGFPAPIAVAATWEPALVEAMTTIVRREMRALGIHQALAPVLDVARDARWGRVGETYGEDPFLCVAMGVAFVRGLQGAHDGDAPDGVLATAKHFLGYGAADGGRNLAGAQLSHGELFEVYARPFEAAIRDADLAAVMPSYSAVNGEPPHGSRRLLGEVLRDRLGFGGMVVSDYGAITMLATRQETALDDDDAGVQALVAGVDVELPERHSYAAGLVDAVKNGDVDVETLDASVRRVLTAKLRLGLFERPYVDADEGVAALGRPDGRDVARELAVRAAVLLRNDDARLPLPKDLATIAVIGPNADSVRNLFSGYTSAAATELGIANELVAGGPGAIGAIGAADAADAFEPVTDVAPDAVEATVRARHPDTRTVLDAIRAIVSPGTRELHAPGCTVRGPVDASSIAAAVAVARGADVAILVLGDKTGWAFDATSGEGRDRASLELPGAQRGLLDAVLATGTPVVVVLVGARPVPVGGDDGVATVLQAWQPGAAGGEPIAALLFGDANPSGKLPITIPRTAGQCPIFAGQHAGSSYDTVAEGTQRYTDVDRTPAYAFGHGRSYTTFEYRALALGADIVASDATVAVSVALANTGDRDGDEVVQLYARTFARGVTRPVRELVGFRRVTLAAGARATVTFDLDVALLAHVDVGRRLTVPSGAVQLLAGGSSADLPLRASFTITGPPRVLAHRTVFDTASTVELAAS